MADVLTNFSKTLNNFPKHPGDLNILCSITYAEYLAIKQIVDVLLLPSSFIIKEVKAAIQLIDTATYKTIISGLNKLNATLHSILPPPFNTQIDLNVTRIGNMLMSICSDLTGSLPEDMFDILQDFKHGLTDLSKLLNGIMSLPSSLSNNIIKSLLQLKNDMMKEIFGVLFDTILAPLIEYEAFLESNGIFKMINKLASIERCMTKPGICNRSRLDFTNQNATNVLGHTAPQIWSEYYRSQFLFDMNGNIKYKFLLDDSRQISRITSIVNNMNKFLITVH